MVGSCWQAEALHTQNNSSTIDLPEKEEEEEEEEV
jgi:hypothetical protein